MTPIFICKVSPRIPMTLFPSPPPRMSAGLTLPVTAGARSLTLPSITILLCKQMCWNRLKKSLEYSGMGWNKSEYAQTGLNWLEWVGLDWNRLNHRSKKLIRVFAYVALLNPESTKFQCYLGPSPRDWRTFIHINEVPTVFHIDHISQGACKTVRTILNCFAPIAGRRSWRYVPILAHSYVHFQDLLPAIREQWHIKM